MPPRSPCGSGPHAYPLRPWLEQMLARATRVDPHAGPYDNQQALVLHRTTLSSPGSAWNWRPSRGAACGPSASGRRALSSRSGPRGATRIPAGSRRWRSNAIGLRYALLRPRLAEPAPVAPAPEPPSVTERTLRQRLAVAVASQAVEDEASLRVPRGGNLAHRYNAVLKRVLGKGRATMTLPELEAALAWLERNGSRTISTASTAMPATRGPPASAAAAGSRSARPDADPSRFREKAR